MAKQKPEKSPTTGRFVKRGLLQKLADMFRSKRSEEPLLLEHDPNAEETGTTRSAK